ncbi:MAG: hypothetical protein V3U98_01235 [Acidobacteriota bacterium]
MTRNRLSETEARRRAWRSGVLTFAVVAGLVGLVVYLSFGQARYQCEVWMEYRGHSEHRKAAAATREDSIQSAVTSACATLASGMADSMSCSRTPPSRVECREL